MLTIRAMSSGTGYAERHLQYSDYLDRDGKISGVWRGQAAERLGLVGEVTNEQFERMRVCEHPETGEFLRQRRSVDRINADGSKQSSAIHLYDLTFSAPKSVSIVGVLEDPRLLQAHDTALAVALSEAERCATVEDQRGGKKIVRETGNLAMATYQHHASRSLDPQIHSHAVVFNLSYDDTSAKWKALDARAMYDRCKYLSEVYRNSLAYEVKKLGYQIENRWNDRGTDQTFEIKGVSPELCKQFSKRSAEKETAIKDFIAEHGRTPSNNEVSVLVRNTREEKLREISTAAVHAHQRDQLTPEQARELAAVREQAESQEPHATLTAPAPSLEYAKEHLFERISVAHDYELMTEALQHGRGQLDINALRGELNNQQRSGALIGSEGQVATKEGLDREQKMIEAVNRGNGRYEMFAGEFEPSHSLGAEQNRAVGFILRSKDFATCLEGAAGTGKTDTLREIKRGLDKAGYGVIAVAPTQTAVRELGDRGFDDAMTIERLLQDLGGQDALEGKVLIVDEAGMVSGRQMAGLIDLAEKAKSRMLFVGDVRQIRSVEASDALRILQKESKLKTVTLKEVKRQIDPEYREASRTLWKDREKGFAMLEKMGAVQSVDYFDRPQATVSAFMDAKKDLNVNGQEPTVIVISPTHHDIDLYSNAIRDQLKSEGKLRNGKAIERLEALNWTTAQRKDIRRYEAGQVLVFHKTVKNAERNEQFTVLRTEDSKLIAKNGKGEEISFTKKQAGAFGVFGRQAIEVATGDQLLLQANHKQRGLQITNGDVAVVRSVDSKGRIQLEDGRRLPAHYRQLNYGYAMTAHRSQGRTADGVIVSADKMDGDLFYVAATRGKRSVRVITSNLPLLRQSVTWDSKRQSATELVGEIERKERERSTAQAEKAAREWNRKLFINSRNARTNFIAPTFGHQKAGLAHSED